ncbi:sensor histidine kinase [Actinacidiphila acidipaludis]|uniref:histidine kinase n=1 Tax=Actinacidiphila acidipaludis TaxID=2873382 RepID=A0ABS7PZF4_9ACTN|nr:HAMP domain-containing sensor histidine kinase [Streptomyces acidipaludis]MBY8876231.1 HAMP domain-containing histidine kinase [Streptomyces acidipaludis]
MTRRVALAVMALVTLVLLIAVLPLGLSLARQERNSFRDGTVAADRALAAAAEEHLPVRGSTAPLRRFLERSTEPGDCSAVFDAAGRELAVTPCPGATGAQAAARSEQWAALARSVLAHPRTVTRSQDDRLVVAVPVGDESRTVGVSVLSRSSDATDDRIAAMWLRLAAVGVGGLVAGALLAVFLARWVGRPLRAVDAAAHELGEGDLTARAAAGRGPVEVRRLAATFNTMAARMEALIHGHRAVIADVSHQLRTPMAALRLRLDMLSADADEAAGPDFAAAQQEIARLSRLVDGLLAVARAENAVPRPVAVRVDEVVADRLAAWAPVAQDRRVRLTARCHPGLTARLGPGDLEQVLDNLLANALDALDEGGHIALDGLARHGQVILTVTDNGPGMSRSAQETAFHRFSGPETSGTGLGLAIVHRLLTANGGSVRLEDTPGGGLTVVLELPPGDR